MRYRTKLTLFRTGLFVCFVWAMFTATHFHLPSSVIAVLKHNPTEQELVTQAEVKAERQTACVKTSWKGPTQEFPVACLEAAPLAELPRDAAWRNLERFAGAIVLLVLGMGLVFWLGARMARESEERPLASGAAK